MKTLKLSRMLEGESVIYFEYRVNEVRSLTLICDKSDRSVSSVICMIEPAEDVREIVVDHDMQRLMYIENITDEDYNLNVDELVNLVRNEEV